MKALEKKQAVELRLKGWSIKDIAGDLGVAKSSVSIWVRSVELSSDQIALLLSRSHLSSAVEKRRKSRLRNEELKRNLLIDAANKQVHHLTKNQIWMMGVMLYWAEGGKTQRTVRYCNSDPNLIRIMMVFFRDICQVPEIKFRGHINIHPHLNEKESKRYWSKIAGIPSSQFYKSAQQVSKASQNKKDSLPLGTMTIYVHDVLLFYNITGWVNGIFRQF